LILTGSSAGSLGTQIWSRKLLEEFSWRDAAVIADSYAGIFPVGVQGYMMKNFGLCKSGLLSGGMQFLCITGTVDVQQVYQEAMRWFPEVLFASLDSRIDFVQIAFFKVVHKSLMGYGDSVGPQQFSSMVQNIYGQYNMHPNWVSYSVNSGQHMYLNNDVMYQTTPVGNQITSDHGISSKILELAGTDITGDDTPLVKWLAELPVHKGHSTESHCAGVQPKPITLPPLSLSTSSSGGFLGALRAGASRMANVAKSTTKFLGQKAVNQVASHLGFEINCPDITTKVFLHAD